MAEVESINGNPIVAEVASESIQPSVDAWLAAHPEATTTVQDGAISYDKLASDLRSALNKENLMPVSGNGPVAVLGLTAAYNDGVLTASGTATGNGGRLNKVVGPFTLAAGTYTLSRSLDNSTNLSIMLQTTSGNSVLANAYNDTPATFTLESSTSVYIGINAVSGRAYDVSVEVQLNNGSTAGAYVSPSTIVAIDAIARAQAATNYENSVHKMDANDGITDADDADINRIYLLVDVSGVANLPTNKSGTLITLARHQMATVQLYCDASRMLYYRGNWGNLGWSEWKQVADLQTVSAMIPESVMPNIMTAFTNITCCGDSLTYSQVYLNSSSSRQAYVTYPAALGRLTGAAVTQYARPGYTAVQWWDAFKDNIDSATNQLSIIFLGTNGGLTDTLASDAPSGASPTSWNTATNTGAYARIVNDYIAAGSRVVLLRCYATSGTSGVSDLAITNSVIDQIGERFGCAVVDAPHLTANGYHYWPSGAGTNDVHYNDLGYGAFAGELVNRISALGPASMKLIIPA